MVKEIIDLGRGLANARRWGVQASKRESRTTEMVFEIVQRITLCCFSGKTRVLRMPNIFWLIPAFVEPFMVTLWSTLD
jgi:hypothetical protein